MTERSRRVAVALGSNLGERRAHLDHAAACLRSLLDGVVVSHFIETAPYGVDADQPRFLNGAAVGWSAAMPGELLSGLRAIEVERGRARPYVGAPRTLDLDLILVGDLVVKTDAVTVPHPRFRERHFVLSPLASIAPDLVDPVTRRTVGQLLAALP